MSKLYLDKDIKVQPDPPPGLCFLGHIVVNSLILNAEMYRIGMQYVAIDLAVQTMFSI